jgi:hypothetical protein
MNARRRDDEGRLRSIASTVPPAHATRTHGRPATVSRSSHGDPKQKSELNESGHADESQYSADPHMPTYVSLSVQA